MIKELIILVKCKIKKGGGGDIIIMRRYEFDRLICIMYDNMICFILYLFKIG